MQLFDEVRHLDLSFRPISEVIQWQRRIRRLRRRLGTGEELKYFQASNVPVDSRFKRSDEDTSPTKPAGAPTLVKDAVDDDEEEEEEVQPKSASKFSFANLGDDDGGINNDQASDDEGNDLMAAARASEKRRKEKKGKKTPAVTNGEPLEDATDSIDYASKAPVEMTADQLMEEEFGPTKVKLKGKKGKKGKLQQMVNDDEDEPLSGPAAQQTAIADAQAAIVNGNLAVTPDTPVKLQGHMLDEEDDAGEAQEEGANKVLSKKEKERIKKEKDKVGCPYF